MSAEKLNDSLDQLEQAVQAVRQAATSFQVEVKNGVADAAAAAHGVTGGIDPFVFQFSIFVLAIFVGYYVVWSVTPALYTPLMSVTNAISGIILVGGMLHAHGSELNTASILGGLAVFLATINIVGGFAVTHRMLQMFRK